MADFWANLTGGRVHTGSWGTPELGLSEAISNIFGQGRTGQGGSNLFGPVSETTLVPVQPGNPSAGFQPAAQPIQRQPTRTGTGTPGGGGDTELTQLRKIRESGGLNPIQESRLKELEAQQSSGPSMEDIINQQYGSIASDLDRIINWLPEWQKELEGKIGSIAESQKTGLTTSREAQLSRFPIFRQNVEQQQVKTLRDLAQNIRNVLNAGNIYLGARGAGDSSGADMFSFATTQEANRQRGSILAQTSQMLKEIDMKEADVRSAFEDQMNAVDTWKNTQITQIAQDFMSKKEALMAQKPNIRAQAVQTWLNYLTQVETQARQWQAGIDQWARDRMATLNNWKVQIGNSAQFNPRDLVWQELGFSPATITGEVAPQNPWLISRKKLLGEENT